MKEIFDCFIILFVCIAIMFFGGGLLIKWIWELIAVNELHLVSLPYWKTCVLALCVWGLNLFTIPSQNKKD